MRSSMFIAVAMCFSLAACGDDDGGSADASLPAADAAVVYDAPVPDATPVDASPPAPGKVTIVATDLTGLVGKVLLISAFQATTRAGGACDQITVSPETITTVLKVPNQAMGNPCDLGADALLDPGTYQITAGTYTPGEMTPGSCATTTAEVVDGDVTVNLPALGACP